MAALVLIGIGALVVVAWNMDRIVKTAVEEVGTRVTGTRVSVGSVETHLLKGQAVIRDFSVANPEGYSEGAMISIVEISADVDFRSGAIRDVRISKPYIYAEQRGGGNNFKTVRDHVEGLSKAKTKGGSNGAGSRPPSQSGDVGGTATSGKEGSAAKKKAPVTLQLDNFDMLDAVVAYNFVDTEVTGSVSVASIGFEGLNGTVEQVTRQVLLQLASQVITKVVAEVAGKGVKSLIEEHQTEIDKARADIEKVAGELDEELGEKVKDALGDVMKFLGE